MIYLLFQFFNATEGRDGLSFGYLLSKFSKVVWFAPHKRTLSSVQFKIIMIYCDHAGWPRGLARGIDSLKTLPTSLANWSYASGLPDSDGVDPSSEYCANKQQGLKPPRKTVGFFWD